MDGQPCAKAVGSLEVAWTSERLADLRRKSGFGRSWGVESEVISASEAREMIPALSDRILGALYVPSDIHTKATRPAEAMAREAEREGAAFYGGVKVTGLGIKNGRVASVETDQRGDRDRVGGFGGGNLGAEGRADGADCHTAFAYAASIRGDRAAGGACGATEEISQPLLRHQDRAMYFRQEGESYGIGSYNHEPLLVESEDILDHSEAPIAPAEMEFTPSHFEGARAAMGELLPCLDGVSLTRRFNGLFSFTNDGFPVLGESPEVGGFWSAQAVWITHAGCRQGGRGVDSERGADDGSPGVRHPQVPSARADAALRSRPLRPAVPRGVRHHPSAPAGGESARPAADAVPRSAEGTGRGVLRERGLERPQWHEANEGLLDSLDARGRRARAGRRGSGLRS